MAFFESPRFPDDISYGSSFGPGYSTGVVTGNSGFELRNQNWLMARCSGDVSHGLESQDQLDVLLAFFRICKGRANGFRFKDWSDYIVTISNGVLGLVGADSAGGIGTGYPTYQSFKRYVNAAGSEDRLISKLVAAGLTFYRNAGALTVGGAPGNISTNVNTGIITFVADVTKSITAITKANPGKITTSASHTYTNGQLIYLSGIGGMVKLNGVVATITNVDADEFTIGIDTTNYTTYTSGGTANKYPQPADALTWAGQFDVPCRFDIDEMRPSVDAFKTYSWSSIPIVEIRV
jgi:uncharacterized protein (TIGR02217 family)